MHKRRLLSFASPAGAPVHLGALSRIPETYRFALKDFQQPFATPGRQLLPMRVIAHLPTNEKPPSRLHVRAVF